MYITEVYYCMKLLNRVFDVLSCIKYWGCLNYEDSWEVSAVYWGGCVKFNFNWHRKEMVNGNGGDGRYQI